MKPFFPIDYNPVTKKFSDERKHIGRPKKWSHGEDMKKDTAKCPCCDGAGVRFDRKIGHQRTCLGCNGTGIIELK
jgi:DnaJ-class molecular chaperone